MDEKSLPTFPQMLADRLKAVSLPDESYIGEPFWVIMEVGSDNKVTGAYYGTNNPYVHIPLYYSKRHAEAMLSVLNKEGKTRYAVRGLTQFALRAFIITIKFMKVQVMICLKDDKCKSPSEFFGFGISLEELEKQYYYGGKIE